MARWAQMERKNAITYTHTGIKFKVVRREQEWSNWLLHWIKHSLLNSRLHYLKVDCVRLPWLFCTVMAISDMTGMCWCKWQNLLLTPQQTVTIHHQKNSTELNYNSLFWRQFCMYVRLKFDLTKFKWRMRLHNCSSVSTGIGAP